MVVEFDDAHRLAYEDAMDIAALGFDEKNTKLFINTDYEVHAL